MCLKLGYILRYNNPFKLLIPKLNMAKKEKIKIAVVAGASRALKYKALHPRATDEDAIQHVSREVDEIIENLDKEE